MYNKEKKMKSDLDEMESKHRAVPSRPEEKTNTISEFIWTPETTSL